MEAVFEQEKALTFMEYYNSVQRYSNDIICISHITVSVPTLTISAMVPVDRYGILSILYLSKKKVLPAEKNF